MKMNEWGGRYQAAFLMALALHFGLGVFLAWEPSSSERPVMIDEAKNIEGQETGEDQQLAKQPEIVKAITVDESAVKEQIDKIKHERAEARHQEEVRQQALTQAAEAARQSRVLEQKHLQALKAEAEKIAIAKQKAIEEEQKRLKQVAEQQEKERKTLEALKEKQVELKLKQVQDLKKQQTLAKAEAKNQLEKEVLKAKQAAAASTAAAEKAAMDAARRARLSGVVDKYKAQILQAISRQWILPENLRPGLSSQFRIRLAPNGAVLEVSLIKSSGDPILDRSAQTAIYKASPLPVPEDAETFDIFRDISLTVRPESARG